MNIIYEISDPITGKKYIGSKCNWKGQGTYFGSSRNEEMLSIIKERKHTLEFNVLEYIESKDIVIEREQYWQRLNRVVESEEYWNLKYATSWHSFMIDKKHSPATLEKMRVSQLGKIITKEAIEATSKTVKAIWDEKKAKGESYCTPEGMEAWKKNGAKVGKLVKTEEQKRKLREINLGSSNTPESKIKASKALKLKYLNGEIENAYAKKVIATSETDETETEHKSITQASIFLGKGREPIRQAIKTGKPLGGFYWKLK
jgi:hypothetical protein